MAVSIGTGDLAFADTFSGLVPCRIISVTEGVVTVKLTATRKAYKRGEVVVFPPYSIVPRSCIRVRGGQYRINTNYEIRDDNPTNRSNQKGN